MKKAQLFSELGKWVLIAAVLILLVIFIVALRGEISILTNSLFGRGF